MFYRCENPGGGLAEAGHRGSAVEALRPAREVEDGGHCAGPGVSVTPEPRQRARESGIGPAGQRLATRFCSWPARWSGMVGRNGHLRPS
jgi:hypothetical protein